MSTSRLRTLAVPFVSALAASISNSSASAQGIAAVAAEIGITPESMVIAGCTPAQAAICLTRIEDEESLCETLATQQLAVDAAADEVADLADALVVAAADSDLAAQLVVAIEAFSLAKEQLAEIRSQLFAIALEGAGPDQIQGLVIWRNGARHTVPAQFRVRERSEHEWMSIKRALRAERRALRLGEDLADEHAELLAAVRADPLVIQAEANLQTGLAVMEALFEQFEE